MKSDAALELELIKRIESNFSMTRCSAHSAIWGPAWVLIAAAMLSSNGQGCVVVYPIIAAEDYASPRWDLSPLTVTDVDNSLQDGFDPLFHDGAGDTALHWAAATRNPDYLRLLLRRGYDRDTANARTGRTPIVTAMLAERDKQVRMLIAAGADLARGDAMDNSPLHTAAQINKPRYILALLEGGAPAEARNRQGHTFQRYLYLIPERLLNARTRRELRQVEGWLRRRGIASEKPGVIDVADTK